MTAPPRVPPDWPNRDASRAVREGGLRWHVQDGGTGPATLFLHGAGGAGHSWRWALPEAAGRGRAVAPDLPGHGFTEGTPPGGLGLEPMAAAVVRLLDALDCAPRTIVGHSAGGALALRLALDLPRPPARLVLVNPALADFPGLAGLIFPLVAKALAFNPITAPVVSRMATPAATRRVIEGTGSALPEDQLRHYHRLFADRAHVAGTLRMMASWDLAPLRRRLPEITAPALVLAGGRDLAVPPSVARDVADRLPGGALRVIGDLGHLLHEERPAALSDALADGSWQGGAQGTS